MQRSVWVGISFLLLLPALAAADERGSQYCVTPAFVSGNIPPNLLLMIDNSASMYDLAFSDEGKKHCSGSSTTCTDDSQCDAGQTCSVYDRQPYYCYDQTYTNSTTYAGYFKPATLYVYDKDADGFVATTTAYPAGCGTHGTVDAPTTTKKDSNSTFCVEYDSSRELTSFVAKGNYLNWLSASKFDVEKQILTGGKVVSKVCENQPDRACTANTDCPTGAGNCVDSTTFLQPESRGCVGQGYIKDAITGNFVNYAAPATNNTNTQVGVTFSVRGPINPFNITAPSTGGQTYIDLFSSSKKYDFSACQTAIQTISSTSSSNSQVKQDVAACLSGSSQGTCSDNSSVTCFSTYPDCYVPGRCSGDPNRTCLTSTDCVSGQTCTFGYFCETNDGGVTNISCPAPGLSSTCPQKSYFCDENNPDPPYTSPKTINITCLEANVGKTTGCYTAPTYWCDWGAEWMSSSAAPNGYSCTAAKTNDPACFVNNTEQGKCSLKNTKSCASNTDCGVRSNGENWGTCIGFKSQGAHDCIQHTAAIDHGTCRLITGATNGICGGQKDYGVCVFGSSDTLTKTKVNFQQTMQACWQYNRYVNNVGGAADIGGDDVKTMDKQCSDIYNGSGTAVAYMTCSDDHLKTCTAATVATDCGTGATCTTGPAAIDAGSPALICGSQWEGQLYYKNASNVWVKKGSLNDKTTPLSSLTVGGAAIAIPSACVATDTFPACMTKIYRAFCNATQVPGVADPTDAPSDSSTYDNVPAILSGIGVESQLGAPIAKMRARVAVTTPACTENSDCGSDSSCIDSKCKPSGLIQQFGPQIRIGAMTFNKYGSKSEALDGAVYPNAVIKKPKVCSNDPQKFCVQASDCGSSSTITITCDYATDLDGAKLVYPIGKGLCGTKTETSCSSDAVCGSSGACYNRYCWTLGNNSCTTSLTCSTDQACIRKTTGDHSTADTLVNTIDSIRANAWTPFAEGMYNALGYFATVPQTGGGFKSRTELRLNDSDFDENLNPSEYRCQQNHILLITDGSSTADRNDRVSTPSTDPLLGLAPRYATASGSTSTYCPAVNGVDYKGTSNLPILSWIGRREKLDDFSLGSVTPVYCSGHTTTSCRTDNDCPSGETCGNGKFPRDYVNTWVVFNGAGNGGTGACGAYSLLSATASNGGTTLKQAKRPADLLSSLTDIFQNIAAKASSGTAASILSNSEGSGANILQAVFYPKKIFENHTSSAWVGEMQNLWYFVDPMISRSTIREDTPAENQTTGDKVLNLVSDKVVSLRFDASDNTTYAYISSDTNGDGLGDTAETKEDADLVNSLWRAGKQLYKRDLTVSPRVLYTPLISGGTQVGSTGLMHFSYGNIGSTAFADNSAILSPYLAPTLTTAKKLMQWVHGFDFPGDTTVRSRTVKIGDLPGATISSDPDSLYVTNPKNLGVGVWKLGDIISSTPRIQSNGRLNNYGIAAPGGYSDPSYNSFLGSTNYKGRGMVYVGANDGMLHAFKLGLLDVTATGYTKATLSGTGLGEEKWAFIPKQSLPYLKYYSHPDYNHIYSVDGSTVIVDASIGNNGTNGCTKDSYDTCIKSATVVDGSNALNGSNTWMTVLVGGMGLGGASGCTTGNCVDPPLTDPSDLTKKVGYSSYFALDVTNHDNPSLLWEFSDPEMGYATTGPAIVRVGESTKNGRWFAVFGSGPTGPISDQQFMGRSDQTLKFFIVDLRTGELVQTIDTGIADAFAGSMVGGAIDADRWNPTVTGNYQDDAIYVGYTYRKTEAAGWTNGGVLRIVTGDRIPKKTDTSTHWTWSRIIDDVGPVTTGISRLQDRKNKKLWLYFGTGRYYSRTGSVIDDYKSPRAIYGIKDPCYNTNANPGNRLDKSCMEDQSTASRVTTGITNQSTTITDAAGIGVGGWMVELDPYTTTYGAERVVTDAVALTNGTIFVTSFEPTADPCGFGGNSYLWALDYQSGGRPTDAALGGKALIQLSTGEFKEVDLAQAFGAGAARLMRRTSMPMTGKPPADAFPVISKSANKPVKRILHIQER